LGEGDLMMWTSVTGSVVDDSVVDGMRRCVALHSQNSGQPQTPSWVADMGQTFCLRVAIVRPRTL
jgi:hypothetical protein